MAISDNLRGALYMNLSMFAFTVNDTFMKAVTETLPLYQTIALRGVIAVIGLFADRGVHRWVAACGCPASISG